MALHLGVSACKVGVIALALVLMLKKPSFSWSLLSGRGREGGGGIVVPGRLENIWCLPE